MKYYIPTSSLNIDNILSSESIAPENFYSQRTYGYKSFEIINGINYHNSIILLSEILFFGTDDNDDENYPMIVEVDSDFVPQFSAEHKICNKDFEMLIINQTIYLNPLTCRIYFFDERALSMAKLNLENSNTSKMAKFYPMDIIPETKTLATWENDYLPVKEYKQIQDIANSIAQDDKINRIKGFLFAYLDGVNKSLSNNLAQLLSICRRMYDIISSILNDINNMPVFIDELNNLRKSFCELDPERKRVKELFREFLLEDLNEKEDSQIIENKLYKLFGERETKIKFAIQKNINILEFPEFSKQISKEDWMKINELIQQYSVKIYESNNNSNKLLSDYLYKIKTNSCTLTGFEINIPKDDDLYKMILNDCFFTWGGITLDSVRIDRGGQGTLITNKVKSYFDELDNNYWVNSDDKKYFHSLRKNIANPSKLFELNETKNIVELSIAAFLLKGENLTDLHRYIVEQNGIGNLSYAYGLWGAASGFANMSKTLTNDLFLSNDNDYILEVYNYIFKQVHGIELEKMLEKRVEKTDVTTGTTDSPKIDDRGQRHEKEIKEAKPTVKTQIEQELSELENFSSRDPKTKREIITKLEEVRIFSLSEWNDKKVDNIQWTTKKGQKTLMSAVKAMLKDKKQSEALKIGFDLQPGKEFYKDDNAFSLLESLLPCNQKTKKQFQDDLDWFQKNYKESYDDTKQKKTVEGRYSKDSKDNSAVIDRFKSYLGCKRTLKNTAKADMKWLRDIYFHIDIDKIISKLKEVYLQHE
jgi:hypothetical protein